MSLVGDRVHEQAQEEFDYKVHLYSWSLRNTPVANQDSSRSLLSPATAAFPFGALPFLSLFSMSSLSAVSHSHSSQTSSPQARGHFSDPVHVSLVIPSTGSVETAQPPGLLTPSPTPSHLASRTPRVHHHDPRPSLYSVSRYLLCTTGALTVGLQQEAN